MEVGADLWTKQLWSCVFSVEGVFKDNGVLNILLKQVLGIPLCLRGVGVLARTAAL